MADEQKKCRFCGKMAVYTQSGHSFIVRFKGCACGAYYVAEPELPSADEDGVVRDGRYKRLPALLYERRLKGLRAPLLVFNKTQLPEAKENISFAEPIPVDDLLAQWPQTVPERIDRCLCNFANLTPTVGKKTTLVPDNARTVTLLFADGSIEADYYLAAMKKYGWLEDLGSAPPTWNLTITPEGWARVGELSGGAERHRNPAFVAMWFGAKELRNEMDRLWLEFIKPAIEAAGYKAKRADTDEHNEPIMDMVIEYIRQAPFLVAELSDNNKGVYFEAGFAKGRGIEVIYCCREGHEPHFDVTAINLVKWKDEKDLRKRLENRIRGSVGPGPHDLRGVE